MFATEICENEMIQGETWMLDNVDNVLSSFLGNCLLTAKACIALYMYVTFCMMYFFTFPFLYSREWKPWWSF